VQNSAGNVAGFLGPIVTGAIITATGSFVLPLVLTGAIAVIGAMTFLVILPNRGHATVEADQAAVGAV
jgi:ACS family glucarate transporter-like MFS transporter